jgi:hypothetical protein
MKNQKQYPFMSKFSCKQHNNNLEDIAEGWTCPKHTVHVYGTITITPLALLMCAYKNLFKKERWVRKVGLWQILKILYIQEQMKNFTLGKQ